MISFTLEKALEVLERIPKIINGWKFEVVRNSNIPDCLSDQVVWIKGYDGITATPYRHANSEKKIIFKFQIGTSGSSTVLASHVFPDKFESDEDFAKQYFEIVGYALCRAEKNYENPRKIINDRLVPWPKHR